MEECLDLRVQTIHRETYMMMNRMINPTHSPKRTLWYLCFRQCRKNLQGNGDVPIFLNLPHKLIFFKFFNFIPVIPLFSQVFPILWFLDVCWDIPVSNFFNITFSLYGVLSNGGRYKGWGPLWNAEDNTRLKIETQNSHLARAALTKTLIPLVSRRASRHPARTFKIAK